MWGLAWNSKAPTSTPFPIGTELPAKSWVRPTAVPESIQRDVG